MKNRFLTALSFVVCLISETCPAQRTAKPDLGPNVLIFKPSQPAAEIQSAIDKVYAEQEKAEFGHSRYALLFEPGEYHVDIPIGFYTEVRGLGDSPDSVRIVGNVHSDASRANNNATCTFWRSVENFSVRPTGGTMQWAVSQAAPMRRMHILGDLVLHQKHGWASGGWMSDTKVDGNVDSGSQQQWISRNSEWKSWTGSNWNMVFVGDVGAPATAWPKPGYTTVDRTPIRREKPYLAVDPDGTWRVMLPGLQHDTIGASWTQADRMSGVLTLDRFYVAHSERDTAATINAQLAKGKNLLLTPGHYDLTEPIRVTRPDSVVLGLGFATLRPVNGTPALVTTAKATDITVAGLLIDAGPITSPTLMQAGEKGRHERGNGLPNLLADVFFRDGGETEGKTVNNLEINADDTIIDHTWIWRADHGNGVGWDEEPERHRPDRQRQRCHRRTACSSSTISSSRWSGTVNAAARTCTNPRSRMTRQPRPRTPARPAPTAGPPTRWARTSACTRRGDWACTASLPTRTSGSHAPSRRRRHAGRPLSRHDHRLPADAWRHPQHRRRRRRRGHMPAAQLAAVDELSVGVAEKQDRLKPPRQSRSRGIAALAAEIATSCVEKKRLQPPG